jgi:hypothetical protein
MTDAGLLRIYFDPCNKQYTSNAEFVRDFFLWHGWEYKDARRVLDDRRIEFTYFWILEPVNRRSTVKRCPGRGIQKLVSEEAGLRDFLDKQGSKRVPACGSSWQSAITSVGFDIWEAVQIRMKEFPVLQQCQQCHNSCKVHGATGLDKFLCYKT